ARRELLTQELLDLPQKFAEYRIETSKRFDTMDTEFGSIKGMVLGSNLERIGLANMVTDFRLRGVRIVRLAEYNRASEDFNEAVWNAVDDGTISEAERKRLTVTDMIVRARIGRDTDTHAYVAAEASYTIDEEDIAKVRASADALQKVFPDDTVFACLYGVNIRVSLLADASDNNVTVYIDEQL
ncbi:MAG: hypothetical protein OXC95_12765, partial [Dehalococcoidia bacterium]|nr:hypothetical protein [Dehalococcoidia bacterium]